jgi:hypothetical protein
MAKPDGVGGTTIAQQILLARAGIKPPQLLGIPILRDDRRVLYLALDRPPPDGPIGFRATGRA